MNKYNAKDYLPLVQALAEGKVIQMRGITEGEWVDIDGSKEIAFSSHAENYRVKPDPKEMWVNRYPNGVDAGNYASRMDAYDHRANDSAIQVLYREVVA